MASAKRTRGTRSGLVEAGMDKFGGTAPRLQCNDRRVAYLSLAHTLEPADAFDGCGWWLQPSKAKEYRLDFSSEVLGRRVGDWRLGTEQYRRSATSSLRRSKRSRLRRDTVSSATT